MKFLPYLWLLLVFSASAMAQQNYQYQYPNDPYNSAPHPQPNAAYAPQQPGGPVANGEDYAYDKLLTYGYLEAQYAFNDYKNNNLSGTSGINLALNVALFKPLYLHFGMDYTSGSDSNSGSYSLAGFSAGGGVYLPLMARFHLFGEVGFHYDDTSGALNAISDSEFSVYIKPGLRFAATDQLELDASVYFATSSDLDDRALQFNAYYAVLSVLDLNFGIDFGSDINSYHAGVRLRW